MSNKFTNAVALALFAAAVPLNATAEMMSLAEYLASKPEPATSTTTATDGNPFENLSLELPTTAPNSELFTESGLPSHRIEMPPTPPTPGSPARLTTAFVVFESGATGDYVREIACEPDTTVGSALKTQVYPHPIDFSKARIAVHRASHHINDDLTLEAGEEILRIEWDTESGQPTKATNHHLQPSDRLFVTVTPSAVPASQPNIVPAPVLAATPRPDAAEAVSAPVLPYDPTGPTFGMNVQVVATDPPMSQAEMKALAPSTVKFDVIVVEDVGDSFAEFEELRSQMPCMLTDTSTIQGTLRILEKHKLVRRVSSPKLMVAAGERATLAIGSETPDTDQPWQGIKAEMGARELGGGLVVDFSLANTEGRHTNKVQTSLIVPHGQTVIMKTGSQLLQASTGEDTAEDKVEHAVYVVLTPEIVK